MYLIEILLALAAEVCADAAVVVCSAVSMLLLASDRVDQLTVTTVTRSWQASHLSGLSSRCFDALVVTLVTNNRLNLFACLLQSVLWITR